MIDRPDNLRQHVRDAVAEGDEYATPYAWVLEDGDAMWYTCKNCGRVFEGHHAFAGHCGSSPGCGVERSAPRSGRGEPGPDVSNVVRDVLEHARATREATRERHSLRQVPHQDEPPPAPAPARRWWWPW